MSHLPVVVATTEDVVLQFDTSPWGAGATLKYKGTLREYWVCTWDALEVSHFKPKIKTGVSDHMTFWESLAFLMCCITWQPWIEAHPVMIVGDNTGSLQNSLDLKGKGPLLAVSRELAWRKARHTWQYDVAHLPTEHNTLPYILSRVSAPEPEPWPYDLLQGLVQVQSPTVRSIWTLF